MADVDVTGAEQSPHLRVVADEMSRRLYHLCNIAKMAAFACEARRVLDAVSSTVLYRDEMRKTLDENIATMNDWCEMDDTTGEVLRELAQGMDALNTDWTNAIYKSCPQQRSAS